MKNITKKTKLALDLILSDDYDAGSGYSLRGKKYITDYTISFEKKESITIPYDAYKLIQQAKELILIADTIIKTNRNIEELKDIKTNENEKNYTPASLILSNY